MQKPHRWWIWTLAVRQQCYTLHHSASPFTGRLGKFKSNAVTRQKKKLQLHCGHKVSLQPQKVEKDKRGGWLSIHWLNIKRVTQFIMRGDAFTLVETWVLKCDLFIFCRDIFIITCVKRSCWSGKPHRWDIPAFILYGGILLLFKLLALFIKSKNDN